ASCMHPRVCPGFAVDQSEAVELLRAVRATPGVRHVRVASGVRFDLALRDADALRAYTMEFTGGQLKVAPEHICDSVLDLMRKPGLAVFERFLTAFADHSTAAGKEQYVVPYLLSAFPGCTDDDMRTLSRWLAARGWSPRQVQCFIPTPGTVATAMFFAGIDPAGNPVPVARTDAARLR
ncbi:YgiQ family radical SAM protein, partial [Desulfovibrio sp. XJ01]|nr:YgiQ family radical SAM protein [Nitratidesulfovibrio liaohensis]